MTMLDELVALGWPRALITLDEWDTLPEDNETRVECVEGMVVMMAPADSYHQRAMSRIWSALDRAVPDGLEALTEVGVVVTEAPPTVRVPDVSVVTRLEHMVRLFEPTQVRLAVEIVSPGSRRVDFVLKAAEYAEAGVAEYWILDRDDLVLSTFRLGPDGYALTGEHRGAAIVETCGVTVSLDVSKLV